jgi:L-fuconolactonase
LEEAGVDGGVAVQARQMLKEIEWLLGLAGRHEFLQGVVGWVLRGYMRDRNGATD